MNVDKVYEKINNNGIKLFPYCIPNVKSICVETCNRYGIFINYDEIKDSEEEFLVLTHEYGHCMTGSTHPPHSTLDILSKHEYRADRKAILEFLPIDKLRAAMQSGCKTAHDFAEFLTVPEQFVIKAFQHYTAMELI